MHFGFRRSPPRIVAVYVFVLFLTKANGDIKGHLLVIYYVPGTVLAENLTPFVVFDILRAQ